MPPPATRTIAIVLDPEFSTRVASLAERVAVWIVDSDANRPAIEALWNARRSRQVMCDVTIFRPIPGLSTEDHLDGVLYIDYLSRLKRDRVIKKFDKAAKRAAG